MAGNSNSISSASSKADLIVTAKTYSGCYGGETANIGDSVIVKLQCGVRTASLARKQIIFVVDESGSMCNTMPSVKASLFAARNALLRLLECDSADEEERDRIFTQECNSCIITFSDVATCKWDSAASLSARSINSETIPFSHAVNGLQSGASTNMGDALIMVFDKKLPQHATWIIVLTDGVSNKGPCQTAQSFKDLMSQLPINTKIIPLGYTTEFAPEILSILGDMTYLDSQESIAETLGAIMAEIVTCFGINAKIYLPAPARQVIDPNEMIVVPDNIAVPRDIIGSKHIGCLFNERKFIYGHLPWGNTTNAALSQYHGLKGSISYYDIANRYIVETPFSIREGSSTTPDEIREAYFESSKARLILDIYYHKQTKTFSPQYIACVKAKLADWRHPSAIPHREELLRILNAKEADREQYIAAISAASGARSQTSYSTTGRYSTGSQSGAASGASSDFQTYSTISSFPLVTIDPAMVNALGLASAARNQVGYSAISQHSTPAQRNAGSGATTDYRTYSDATVPTIVMNSNYPYRT